MALQSSGAISMNQIKDEFGGTGSHALSEYHALAGLGVSGIPASGEISFSHFRGKSNQVTTSVWVSSGYNQSGWVLVGTQFNMSWPQSMAVQQANHTLYWIYSGSYVNADPYGYSATTVYYGGAKYTRGAYVHSFTGGNGKKGYRYYISKHTNQTWWVDTSAYQNTATTAQIST
jgi:hypothetical protein